MHTKFHVTVSLKGEEKKKKNPFGIMQTRFHFTVSLITKTQAQMKISFNKQQCKHWILLYAVQITLLQGYYSGMHKIY